MQEVNSSQILPDEQPQIEVTLQQFDELVLDKKALDRLIENPDFNRIIVGKYFDSEFSRLADLLKSNHKAIIKDRDIVVEKICSIGHMENFIKNLLLTLNGLDNPEQRIELVRQQEEYIRETELEKQQELNLVKGV